MASTPKSGTMSGVSSVDIGKGFRQGSINNYGTTVLVVTFSNGQIVNIQPKMVYNFDYDGEPYPALNMNLSSGGNADYIFWY